MGTDSREEQLGTECSWQDHWLGDVGQVFNVLNLSYHFIDKKNMAYGNSKTFPWPQGSLAREYGQNLDFFLFPTSPGLSPSLTFSSQNVCQGVDLLRY